MCYYNNTRNYSNEVVWMITYVKLKNFKSFRETIFDFRKGKKSYKKFVAVYGENGSGKSNFVDSLSFLRLSLESFHMVALQQMQKAGSLPDAFLISLAGGSFGIRAPCAFGFLIESVRRIQ